MAGKAKIRIEGEDATAAAWKSATSRAQANAKAISHAFEAAFAGISLAKLVETVKQSAELGDQLQKASIKAGIGGKAMSELAYAAKLADVDIGGLSTGLKKMQVALSQAATGNKETKGAFDALGISLAEIQKLKPEDQFELIGQRISELTNPADKARAATELFGRAGADLLPLFEQGAAGIQKAREEAEKLGISLDGDAIKRLSELEDAGKRLGAAWHGFAAVLTSEVAPGLTHVLDSLSGTREAELEQQIAFLKKVQGEGFVSINPLGKAGSYKDIGTGVFSAEEGQAMLEKLQAQLDNIQTTKYNLGGRGVHQKVPGGYEKSDAEKAAAAAYAKEMADAKKYDEMFRDGMRDSTRDASKELDQQRQDRLDSMMQQQDDSAKWYEDYKAREKDLQVYREEQWKQSTAVFKDYFVNAFEDMINTGKFQWRGFLTFLVAELAKKQIAKLFDQILGGASGGDGGWFSAILGAVIKGASGSGGGSIDGKASGGNVGAGSMHWVGEKGPELALFGRSATIVPNHALGGGGPNVTVINHIDARGATVDAIKLLPSFGKQISDQTEQRIVSRLRRDFYGLAT